MWARSVCWTSLAFALMASPVLYYITYRNVKRCPVKPPLRRPAAGRAIRAPAPPSWPPPRSRPTTLAAARTLLERGGLTAVTIEAIANKAGVSRPTIYRYWANAPAVAMAAFLEASGTPGAGKSGRSPLAALRNQLHAVADAFAAPA